jgi:hypothetical protein
MRSGVFVRDSASQYEVTDNNMGQVAADVARVIRACASYFDRRHQVLRQAYEDRRYKYGLLADPELHQDR